MTAFVPHMFIPLFVVALLNRYNSAHLPPAGRVINSSFLCLLSVVQTVPEIMILRVVSGISHAFFWPPCEATISNSAVNA